MSTIRAAIITLLLTAMLAGLGELMAGGEGAFLGLALATAVNTNAYWRGAEIGVRVLAARPLEKGSEQRLEWAVERLASAAKIPVPPIYIFDSAQPNALAAGRGPGHSILILSRGLIDELTFTEVEGVIAHEVAHIRSRDTLLLTVSATLAGAIVSWGAAVAGLGFILRKEGRIGLIILGVMATIGAIVLHLALGRGREFAADRAGAELCGHPEWLANALRRIARQRRLRRDEADAHPEFAPMFFIGPLVGSRIARLFETHPPVSERIIRLDALARDQKRQA